MYNGSNSKQCQWTINNKTYNQYSNVNTVARGFLAFLKVLIWAPFPTKNNHFFPISCLLFLIKKNIFIFFTFLLETTTGYEKKGHIRMILKHLRLA